jgi:hypothetical protein
MVKISRIAAAALLAICAMLAGAAPSQAATPALSINDVTVNEPNYPDYEAPAVFTVSLDQAAPEPVTVHWATSKPQNDWNPEFKAASGTVTIPQGEQQGTLTVTVRRDISNSIDRQFTVTLSEPANATIADGTGVGTIINSDRAGKFSCLAEGGEATNTIATITTYRVIGTYVGWPLECNYSRAATYPSVNQGAAGVTFTAGTFDVAVAPTPRGDTNDTRVNVGDGADASAKASTIRITAPGVDVRVETARSVAKIRCEALDVPPGSTGSGAVTGVMINGKRIDEITDHRVYMVAGVRLEFNRQTVTMARYDFNYLTQDAVVINHRALVLSRAQVGFLHDPCSF